MKKKIFTGLICLAFVFSTKAQNAPDTIQISLQQATDIALSENPTIKINDKEIKRVEYSRKEKYGALLPNLSISLSYTRTLKKQKMFFSIPGAPSNPDGFEVGQDNTFNGNSNGFLATIPVIAPALWASLKLTETDMELALENARSSKIDLKNQVAKAYYSVLMAQDSYDVIQKTYENAKENSRIITDKFKQGTVAEFESIRADVQVKNVEANLAATENAVELAKLQLKMLMGVDMDTPIKLQGNLSDYQKSMYADYMKIDTTALTNNSDLKQFDIRSKQLTQSLKVQQAQWFPTLSAMFNYNYMSMVNDSVLFTKDHRWFPTSNVGLTLSIPIFQGGQRYYKEKQLKIQMDELTDQKQSLQRGLQLQAMSYVNNMQKAMKLIESNQEAMRQAEKAMQISEKRYQVGAGTYLDVSTAQLAYMQSGFAYNQAIFDYLTAKTDLEKLLGN
ncbi:Outer membrane efflux protein [uncultured Paludibacter sp.]|uniref:Outer membrane efflux protein n=1 Tax=uncultured Paludibacter sp. TaxID=497635 RepID=A0A653AG97_9BACT|nr:Outer membrane efflux protein [uncultured Paludibacter sp.]